MDVSTILPRLHVNPNALSVVWAQFGISVFLLHVSNSLRRVSSGYPHCTSTKHAHSFSMLIPADIEIEQACLMSYPLSPRKTPQFPSYFFGRLKSSEALASWLPPYY